MHPLGGGLACEQTNQHQQGSRPRHGPARKRDPQRGTVRLRPACAGRGAKGRWGECLAHPHRVPSRLTPGAVLTKPNAAEKPKGPEDSEALGSCREAAFGGCGSRRRPAASCKSTSVSAGSRSRASGTRCICSWRHSATRGGAMRRRSGTSGNGPGLRGSRAHSATSAACRPSCCSTTPVPWSSTTMQPLARSSSTTACMFTRYWGVRPVACAPYRAHQGQGRARRWLRQAQRHRRASLCGVLLRGDQGENARQSAAEHLA